MELLIEIDCSVMWFYNICGDKMAAETFGRATNYG